MWIIIPFGIFKNLGHWLKQVFFSTGVEKLYFWLGKKPQKSLDLFCWRFMENPLTIHEIKGEFTIDD